MAAVTYDVAFCNATTDLISVMPNIETYDRKRQIDRIRFSTYATNVYKAANTGYVGRVFVNGTDLGAAQANIAAVGTDGEWCWDSATDALYICQTSINLTGAADTEVASDTWANIKAEAIGRASERLRGYVNKPILPRPTGFRGSETLRTYEDIIILSTAIYACALLIMPYDPALGRLLEQRVYRANPASEEEPGYADQIKGGHIRLWNETTAEMQQGVVRAVSVDSSTTTGGIDELRGVAWTAFDLIKVKIITGGTFAYGTASTVTYSVWVGDSTGLKMSQVVTAAVINGAFQALAHGLELRWAAGLYAANAEWEVEVRGGEPESGSSVKSIPIWRQ